MLPSFNPWGNLSRLFSESGADLSKGPQQALERLESVAAHKESEIIAWKSAIRLTRPLTPPLVHVILRHD